MFKPQVHSKIFIIRESGIRKSGKIITEKSYEMDQTVILTVN